MADNTIYSDNQLKISIMQDNSEAIARALNKSIIAGLESVGLRAERYAKLLCPVDTGRLRNSITHALDDKTNSVLIGTNVEYGPKIEFGVHYLRDAVEKHKDEYRKVLGQEISTTQSKV